MGLSKGVKIGSRGDAEARRGDKERNEKREVWGVRMGIGNKN